MIDGTKTLSEPGFCHFGEAIIGIHGIENCFALGTGSGTGNVEPANGSQMVERG